MAITINISGGGAPTPSNAATTTSVALDAGASAGSVPTAEGPAAHAHGQAATHDGGAPSSSLVREVEAALRKMRGGADGAQSSPSGGAIDAGRAPAD